MGKAVTSLFGSPITASWLPTLSWFPLSLPTGFPPCPGSPITAPWLPMAVPSQAQAQPSPGSLAQTWSFSMERQPHSQVVLRLVTKTKARVSLEQSCVQCSCCCKSCV